jgi:2-methylcitrate dehydratase PrpD
MKKSAATRTGEPLAVRIAHSVVTMSLNDLPAEVSDKVKLCLFDLIGCAFESRDLPWSRQAVALAEGTDGAATIIGSRTPRPTPMRRSPTR